MRCIAREEGLGTLWSGTGPSLVLAGNPAIQFMIYESLKRFMMGNGKVRFEIKPSVFHKKVNKI